MSMRKIDIATEIDKISAFLRDYLQASGLGKYIIGISGGIDSALSAALAVQGLGPENVCAVLMPYKGSHPDSTADAILLCAHLNIHYETVDISPLVDAYFDRYEPKADNLRRGNMMARLRMCVLYDLSAKYHALVLGTSNQSELMTGYFTQYGDSAAAIEPLGQLYKSEVKAMAKSLGLPAKIIDKTPTADLWPNQSDEAEMGLSYAELDEILWAIRNKAELGSFDQSQVQIVNRLIARSAFKRCPAPMPEAPCSL
ncbi:MAG: synthase [Candidatus Cloacimonadota bacterium]|nr:synthase [Candidatus Cloacimonadota bacterium]